jgi:RNA polymerase sigma factor (sigma-70 family)
MSDEHRAKDHNPQTLSDQSTIDLVNRAKGGDSAATEALLRRCLPQVKRWAHGQLPAASRGHLDTGDLVQDAALRMLQRLDSFEPRHVGAMQGYLRRSVVNRIRDEIRRNLRRPAQKEIPDHPSDDPSPDEIAIREEAYERYRAALRLLKRRERVLVVARIEMQWSAKEIANRFEMASVDAARMAAARAVRHLLEHLQPSVGTDAGL